MKTYFTTPLFYLAILFLMFSSFGCGKKSDPAPTPDEDTGAIQGTPGNPRFNLQFTNSSKADMDIHVLTPNGSEIYFGNPAAQNGKLDIDCLCGDCPTGPNENVYWVPGTSPSGTYKVWVEYYDSCDGNNNPSTFTLRVLNNSAILNTYTGTLSSSGQKSSVYTFTY